MTNINPAQLSYVEKGRWREAASVSGIESDVPVWFVLDYKDTEQVTNIISPLNLSNAHKASLIDPEVRPRLWLTKEGQILLFLRGVNLNPNSEPEDMVSLRIYFDGSKLILLRNRRLQTIAEVKARLINSDTEQTIQQLFCTLLEQILLKIESQVIKLANRLDSIEEALDEKDQTNTEELEDVRKISAKLWRYMGPQQEVMRKLIRLELPWIEHDTHLLLQEIEDQMTYQVEELALVKERCLMLENMVSNKLNQRVNKNLYLISIITAVFIPISFLTGLLGINVGGMPGVDSPVAFGIVCGILLVVTIAEIIYLWRRKWFS